MYYVQSRRTGRILYGSFWGGLGYGACVDYMRAHPGLDADIMHREPGQEHATICVWS